MIKFGTLKQVDKEKINISIGKNETTTFKDGKKEKTTISPELEIEFEFTIDNNNYYFDFYITKPFEDYLKLNNYDKINIDKKYIIEDYALLNNEYATFPNIEIDVQKLGNNLVFTFNVKEYYDEYFFTVEKEFSLSNINESI